MKFSAVATFLALSARAAAESPDFDTILGMIAALQEEANALALLYDDQGLELATLRETCDQPVDVPTGTPIAEVPLPSEEPAIPAPTETEPTPAPSETETNPKPNPTPAPTEAETKTGPTPAPTGTETEAEPTPAPTDEAGPVQPVPGGGSWTPKVGDHWNYNLGIPVDIDANVEVVFIDVGEFALFWCGE